MTPSFQPGVFFDRDGIANVAPSPEEYYVLSVERFFLIPEFLETLGIVEDRGYLAMVVTNQKGVEKGLITMDGVDAIHAHLHQLVARAGRKLHAVYTCPHGGDHPDRKPNPGLLLRAARDHHLDLQRSWMVGDHARDVQAGRAAGCSRTVFVGAPAELPAADYQVASMAALPELLRRELPQM